jgi:hypothetical protein
LLVQDRVRETVERLLADHEPDIVGLSVMSTKDPTQTRPKFPVLAMIKFALGAWATPETGTTWGPAGSLLVIVIVPDLGP